MPMGNELKWLLKGGGGWAYFQELNCDTSFALSHAINAFFVMHLLMQQQQIVSAFIC